MVLLELAICSTGSIIRESGYSGLRYNGDSTASSSPLASISANFQLWSTGFLYSGAGGQRASRRLCVSTLCVNKPCEIAIFLLTITKSSLGTQTIPHIFKKATLSILFSSKVVLVVPQQVRRSHAPALRPAAPRYRKSSHGGDLHFRRYHGPYHSKKPLFPNPPFPHGGDDFDQGHETVNHVQIPYGKEISHAVSYGKGYIPYDRIKDSLSLGRGR